MLETIAVILIILWLLGMVSGCTLGNFIYVLLVVAIVLFLVRLKSAGVGSERQRGLTCVRACGRRAGRAHDGHTSEHQARRRAPCAM